MKEAHPGRFSELGWGRFARAWEFTRRANERFGLADFVASFVIASTVVFMINSRGLGSNAPLLKEGEISSFTVRSPRALEFEDKEALESARLELHARIPEVYDYDSNAVAAWSERWKLALRQMRTLRHREPAEGMKSLSAKLGVPVSIEEYAALAKLDFGVELERSIHLALAPLWDHKVVLARVFGVEGVELVDLKSGKSQPLKGREIETLLTVEEAAAQVGRAAKAVPSGKIGNIRVPWEKWPKKVLERVFELQARLVTANVTPNKKETEARRVAAEKNLRPTFQKFGRGEVIVREGERVTHRDAEIVKMLQLKAKKREWDPNQLAQIGFGTFILWIFLFFARRQFPTVLNRKKDALVSGLFLVSSLAALKLALIFQLSVLAESLMRVPEAFLVFFVPVAAPAIILRLLVGVPLTLMFSVLYALGASLLVGHAGLYGVYVLGSCLVGSLTLTSCRARSDLYRAGIWGALACGFGAALLVAAWGGRMPFSGVSGGDLKEAGDFSISFSALALWTFCGGFIGGLQSSAIALVLTPLFENLLDYTTELKLLELARMDHPLLRDLVLKAPGTYHHSIIVGSLVEAGAEAIDANALLARVGSYYHDIGKTHRAEYFVENQSGGVNPHDQMKPHFSAKIIISHVKEGVQLAQTYKLGKNIIDFIETHHGTSLVSYFYNKAKQEASQPGSHIKPEEIVEDDFRYPGPKPRTKETAILALADSCEAATRSLVDPTPARIEGMVNKIIMKAFTEGALDDADITLSEIHLVGKAFLRILLGIHHNRIQYPDQEKGLPARPVSMLKVSNK